MADLNKIVLSGRLGGDPEMRFVSDGLPVTTFNLANGVYKKGEGDNNTLTTWYRCSIIGKRAETANNLLAKGGYVMVTGTHSIRKYTDKDGNERQSNEVAVDDFILPPRSVNADTGNDANGAPAAKSQPSRATPPAKNKPQPIEDDESLPF